ncbi:MAG: hypothetical protein WKF96_12040 [Solirubrobacteraceae bacterium]
MVDSATLVVLGAARAVSERPRAPKAHASGMFEAVEGDPGAARAVIQGRGLVESTI